MAIDDELLRQDRGVAASPMAARPNDGLQKPHW